MVPQFMLSLAIIAVAQAAPVTEYIQKTIYEDAFVYVDSNGVPYSTSYGLVTGADVQYKTLTPSSAPEVTTSTISIPYVTTESTQTASETSAWFITDVIYTGHESSSKHTVTTVSSATPSVWTLTPLSAPEVTTSTISIPYVTPKSTQTTSETLVPFISNPAIYSGHESSSKPTVTTVSSATPSVWTSVLAPLPTPEVTTSTISIPYVTTESTQTASETSIWFITDVIYTGHESSSKPTVTTVSSATPSVWTSILAPLPTPEVTTSTISIPYVTTESTQTASETSAWFITDVIYTGHESSSQPTITTVSSATPSVWTSVLAPLPTPEVTTSTISIPYVTPKSTQTTSEILVPFISNPAIYSGPTVTSAEPSVVTITVTETLISTEFIEKPISTMTLL